jgi:hypothetical protein
LGDICDPSWYAFNAFTAGRDQGNLGHLAFEMQRAERSYLDLGLVCNGRLAIFRGYDNLKNTKWILLHGMRFPAPLI